MASGVEYGEEADNDRDLDRLAFDLMGGYVGMYGKAKWAPSLAAFLGSAKGTVASIVQFNRRIAPPNAGIARSDQTYPRPQPRDGLPFR